MDSLWINFDRTLSDICRSPSLDVTNSFTKSNILLKFWHLIHTKKCHCFNNIHSSGYNWYKTILTVFYLIPNSCPQRLCRFHSNFDVVFASNVELSVQRTFTPYTILHIYWITPALFPIIFLDEKILKKTWKQNTIKRLTTACLLCSRPHATSEFKVWLQLHRNAKCQRFPIHFNIDAYCHLSTLIETVIKFIILLADFCH